MTGGADTSEGPTSKRPRSRWTRGLAIVGATALVLAAAPTSAQRPKPERLLKETRADGSLVLDESGLTRGFEQIKRMLRAVDVEDIGGAKVEVHAGRLPEMGVDYDSFRRLADGPGTGMIEFQTVSPIKLRTETGLRFGELAVAPGNVADDYPGLFSLWIEKLEGDSWRLIFNHEADTWGTMHDPAADLGGVPLQHQRNVGAQGPFSVAIEPDGGGYLLVLSWGEHSWSVGFTAG